MFSTKCSQAGPVPGNTISDIIVSILEREPDWKRLPANVSSGSRRLLERCLEKDPKHRLRDIGDARIELDDALAPAAHGTGSNAPAVVPPVAEVRSSHCDERPRPLADRGWRGVLRVEILALTASGFSVEDTHVGVVSVQF